MKLRAVANEGVFIKSYEGLDPTTVLQAKEGAGKRRGGGKGGGGLSDLYMGREYHYRPEDHPEDIVHLEPLNKVQELPAVPSDPHAIRTFKGAKIHYAFTIVSPDNFTDEAVRGGWQLPPDFIGEVRKLRQLYDSAMRTVGVQKKEQRPLDTDADLHYRLDRIRIRRQYITSQSNLYGDGYGDKELKGLQEEEAIITKMLAYMDKLGVKSITDLEDDQQGVFTYSVNDKEREVSRGEFVSSHLNYAGQSLAKKIKNPTTPDEREMSKQVTYAAAINLARLYKPFDLIVLPASSSSYNIESLVTAVRQQPGWGEIPYIQLQKLTGDKVLDEIDVASLIERAEEYNRRAIAKEPIHKGLNLIPSNLVKIQNSTDTPLPRIDMSAVLTPENPAWIEWWTAGKIALIRATLSKYIGKPVPIKALTDIDQYKKYIQLYTASSQELQQIAGKRVLILDDNVNHSATMQMVNAVVKKGNPQEVLIYTPFYMGG